MNEICIEKNIVNIKWTTSPLYLQPIIVDLHWQDRSEMRLDSNVWLFQELLSGREINFFGGWLSPMFSVMKTCAISFCDWPVWSCKQCLKQWVRSISTLCFFLIQFDENPSQRVKFLCILATECLTISLVRRMRRRIPVYSDKMYFRSTRLSILCVLCPFWGKVSSFLENLLLLICAYSPMPFVRMFIEEFNWRAC